VENLDGENAYNMNFEQYLPETLTTDRANDNPHLIEEGKSYQRNGA
jgi:hypothetical protein